MLETTRAAVVGALYRQRVYDVDPELADRLCGMGIALPSTAEVSPVVEKPRYVRSGSIGFPWLFRRVDPPTPEPSPSLSPPLNLKASLPKMPTIKVPPPPRRPEAAGPRPPIEHWQRPNLHPSWHDRPDLERQPPPRKRHPLRSDRLPSIRDGLPDHYWDEFFWGDDLTPIWELADQLAAEAASD